jgi:hypothetical protein
MINRGYPCSDEPLASWAAQDADIVEIPLLLPGWQVSALEKEAHQRGLTAAEMVRGVLRDFIKQLPNLENETSLSRQPEVPVKG